MVGEIVVQLAGDGGPAEQLLWVPELGDQPGGRRGPAAVVVLVKLRDKSEELIPRRLETV